MMASSASAVASASAATSGFTAVSSSNSPCAACKFLRRKCQPDCVFAPYFPPDQPQKFANVHKVFGASNVTKLLNDLGAYQREDAVNSLAYEADMRLRDPVYGCVGVISILQHQLRQLQVEVVRAKSELSRYQAAAAANPIGLSNGLANGFVPANPPNGIEFFGLSPAGRDGQHVNHQLTMASRDAGMCAVRAGVHGLCDAAGIVSAPVNMTAMNAAPYVFHIPRPTTAPAVDDVRRAMGPPS